MLVRRACGEQDTNVPLGEVQQIVAVLRNYDRPVEYLELAVEGHVYRRAESRTRLAAELVRFLARHLL